MRTITTTTTAARAFDVCIIVTGWFRLVPVRLALVVVVACLLKLFHYRRGRALHEEQIHTVFFHREMCVVAHAYSAIAPDGELRSITVERNITACRATPPDGELRSITVDRKIIACRAKSVQRRLGIIPRHLAEI